MTNDTKQRLEQAQEICLLGIGGSGMRGLAALLAAQGKRITGTDSKYEAIKDDRTLSNYQLTPENASDVLITKADLIIYSDALSASHPLRQLAINNNIPTMLYSETVGAETSQYENTIAVAGTHGKSSTTAFLAYILESAGYDPTVLLGATVKSWPLGNARIGEKKYFVVEADEYRNHFFSLSPQHIILTAVDFDHPDFFTSLEEVCKSYQTFINKLPAAGKLITTDLVYKKLKNIQWPKQTIVVDTSTPNIPLPIPGEHMQNNAKLAVALANQLGVNEDKARASLANFPGLARRFEKIGQINSMNLFSDYGHHPTEISATLSGARIAFPQKRILAIVEPHTEERLATFFNGYIDALSNNCDGVLVCPIYRARQEGEIKHNSKELVDALSSRQVKVTEITNFEQLSAKLEGFSTEYDVAIAFTAGELDQRLRQISVKAF